jgi:hypothetical protein
VWIFYFLLVSVVVGVAVVVAVSAAAVGGASCTSVCRLSESEKVQ